MEYKFISDGTNTVVYESGAEVATFVNASTTATISGHDITITDGENTLELVDEQISGISSTMSREEGLIAQLQSIFTGGQTGGASFLIASGEVDISVSGTTELTYASGVDGGSFIPTHYVIEAANESDTYTADSEQTAFELTINTLNINSSWGNKISQLLGASTFDFGFKLGMWIDSNSIYGDRDIMKFILNAAATDKWSFVVGATPPSTTQFRVNVKIYGITF